MTGLTVPANVLLLGEYAVLEEGGLGVVAASSPHLSAALRSAGRLAIAGTWGRERSCWPGGERGSLFACCVQAAAETLAVSMERLAELPIGIEIDSSRFYDAGGGKRGFGSSAATAVAVCHSILRSDSPSLPLEATFQAALAAHRAFQEGRGSGYDVAASVFGGVGRFTGGARPRFARASLAWLPTMWLFRGRAAVRTSDSVAKYAAWRAAHRRDARRFLEESNHCVEGFLSAHDWSEASRWIETSRELGVALGEAIGVSALVEPPEGLGAGISKAVGAGNELGVFFSSRRPEGSGRSTASREGSAEAITPLEVAQEGVAAVVAGREST